MKSTVIKRSIFMCILSCIFHNILKKNNILKGTRFRIEISIMYKMHTITAIKLWTCGVRYIFEQTEYNLVFFL